MPPFHHGCRTTTTPQLSGEFDFLEKGNTRASVDGQVNSNLKYYDWLKNQNAGFQDSVLGKTKGKIFRNSGATTEQFKALLTDRYKKEITISQMAAKNKVVADYLKNVK
jgi:hypothetical protein